MAHDDKAPAAKPQGIKRMLKKATNLFTRKPEPDEITTLHPVGRETRNANRASMAAADDKNKRSAGNTELDTFAVAEQMGMTRTAPIPIRQGGGDRAWPLTADQQENRPFFSSMPASNNNQLQALGGGLGEPDSIMRHPSPLQAQRPIAALNVQDYIKEREKLAATLAEMLKKMVSKLDIGAFMVHNYYRRDAMLGGIVTRMVDDKVPLVNIGAAVLDALFNPPTPRSPAFTLPGEQFNHGAHGGNDNYPPPFSQLVPLPAVPALVPDNNNGPSTDPPIRRPVFIRTHNLEPIATIPRYPPVTIARWNTPIINRTQQELNDKDERLAREAAEEDSDNEVPILLPASMDRIHRGYYDPVVDR